jgi:hypothetical protein
MKLSDRIVRSLFVALAVGLGWGIRGDFGHLIGAMYPGAALGLGFAFVSGQKNAFKWAPLLGAIGGLGIATGGAMSYGILHGYAQADTFINYTYGFFTLVLQGGAWGCFGGALIGLALEKDEIRIFDFLSLTAAIFIAGFLFYSIVVDYLGFHINPPRSDLSIGYTGGAIGLFLWLKLNDRRYAFQGAFFGYAGFGMGMALGRMLSNIARQQPFPINHWNVMEVSCGLIGGFIFTFGMLGRKFPEPPSNKNFSWLNICGALYVMALIPLLHRWERIKPEEKLSQWAASLKTYGYENPDALSQTILSAIGLVCLAGLIGAILWLALYFRNQSRWAAFPILFFSGIMLLMQNLNALYFFYPRQPGTINMHFVFWILFSLMILYAIFYKNEEVHESDEVCENWNLRKWAEGCVIVFLVILFISHFVNNEKTMASANTRFPIWSWSDGR